MQELIINLINQYGYFSIAFLIAIENIFPPIPSEVILCFSGFISKSANLNLFLVIIYATIGSMIGAILLYYLGLILNEDRLLAIVDSKVGHILRLKKDKIKESIDCFKEKGASSIFFCRFIPIIRSLISIPAGISKYNISVFLLLTFIGSFIWNTILILLGNMLGENWYLVSSFFDKYSYVILFTIIIIYIIVKYLKRNKIVTIKKNNF